MKPDPTEHTLFSFKPASIILALIGVFAAVATGCISLPTPSASVLDSTMSLHVYSRSKLSPGIAQSMHASLVRELTLLEKALHLSNSTLRPPLTVHAFNTRYRVRQFLCAKAPAMQHAPAACFADPTGHGFIIALQLRPQDSDRRNIRHELTHYVVTTSYGVAPIWLDEGLAKVFECGEKDSINREALTKLQKVLKSSKSVLPGLLARTRAATFRSADYALAWGLCHYLLQQPNGLAKIQAYIKSNETSVEKRFSQTFGMSAAELEPQWRAYVGRLTR